MNAAVPPLAPSRPHPLRRLARPLVTPHVFDFWAGSLNRLWSWERPLARLVGRRRESDDAVTLVLRPNRHWRGFLPGQHVTLGVEIAGRRTHRSYSLSGLPRRDGRIEITVKAIEGGKVSQYLCRQARVGEVFEIGPAFGGMTLPAAPQGRWLMLAAGSGITPLMALIRRLAVDDMPVELTLLYWARTHGELCFAGELEALARRQPRFRFHALTTRQPLPGGGAPAGRIDAAVIERLVDRPADCRVRACGPGGFVAIARELLGERAVSFQAEAFTLPAATVEEAGSVRVRLARSGRTLSVPRGQPLLAALEAQGLRPAYGCRMGICNTCACGKSAGATRHLPSGDLDNEPSPALKLCISSAATDLVLDL